MNFCCLEPEKHKRNTEKNNRRIMTDNAISIGSVQHTPQPHRNRTATKKEREREKGLHFLAGLVSGVPGNMGIGMKPPLSMGGMNGAPGRGCIAPP
jgi:hypothetical protein